MKILPLIISSIILLISTFNLTINAQEIKSFISKEHQFSVDFPESPSIQENTLEGATKAKAYLFNVEQATIVFSVLYINFESLDPKVTANKEAFVRFMGNQIVKTVNGQLLGAINTTFNDFSGRSLKISAENKLLFSRLYYINNNNKDKVYQVSVAVNKPEVPANQDLILNFLNSFKLIDSNGKLISNNQNNLINNFDPSSPKPAKLNPNNSNNDSSNSSNSNTSNSNNNDSSSTNNTTIDNSTNSTTKPSNSDVLSAGNKDIKQPQILEKTKPSYTVEARKNSVEGTVILSAVFRKDGSITDVKIVNGLGYGLDEEAIKAAFLIKFIPGSKDGKPVHVRARLEFTFSLL